MESGQGIERLSKNGKILAIVVRGAFSKPGCTFASPDDFPLQLGIHERKPKEHIKPHKHVSFKGLKELQVQEFLYIESGSAEVSFYHNNKKFSTTVLKSRDMVLLNCAHEVMFLEDTKMIEIKQGPYRGRDAEKEYL